MVDSTNLPEVDINQIATDLNGKMDRDCLNASDTGNIQMAKASMPSRRYIDLTLGASGSTYTAPADGWVRLATQLPAAKWINIVNLTDGYALFQPPASTTQTTVATIVPIRKGNVFRIDYSSVDTSVGWFIFRFVYAIGSESEAS